MNAFLATTGNGLARAARDGNGGWRVDEPLAGQEITCLAVDPLRAGVVYAGTRGNGVLCSNDAGSRWTSLGLAGCTVKAIAASRTTPGVLYAGTKPALLFVSTNNGQTWAEVRSFRGIFSRRFWFSPAEPPFSAYVQGIALSPTRAGEMLVGIEAGAVVRSTDSGETWQDHRPGALRDCHSITYHVSNGDWAYEAGGSGAGTAVSRDGGNTWAQIKAGLNRHYGWACAADPENPEISYLSVSPSPMKAHGGKNAEAHIYRSGKGGRWQKLGGGLPDPLAAMPYALLTDPAEPGCVYAGLSSGEVWQSRDRGETWSRMPFHLGAIHRCLVALP